MIIKTRCDGKKTLEYVKQKCYNNWKTVATSGTVTAQKMKFSIKNFFSKCDQIWKQETADLVAFAEEILNGKLHFACIKSE